MRLLINTVISQTTTSRDAHVYVSSVTGLTMTTFKSIFGID